MTAFRSSVGEEVLEDLRRRLDATRWPDEPPTRGRARARAVRGARAGVVLARRLRLAARPRRSSTASSRWSSRACTSSPTGDGPAAACCCTAGRRACGSSTGSSRCCATHARVIVPSLPGYAYSFTPGRRAPRSSTAPTRSTALMRSLGHERYLVAGGDWGASTAVRLAYAYPDAVQALHLYMMPLRRPRDLAGVRARVARGAGGLERGGGRLRRTSRARGRRRSPTGWPTRPSA